MVFSSLTFLFAFLPITLILYYLMPNNKARNVIILISGIVFYAWGEPRYIILMMISMVLAYVFGIIIEKTKAEYAAKVKTQMSGLSDAQISFMFDTAIKDFSVKRNNKDKK